MIDIKPVNDTYGYYYIDSNDIPVSHRTGEYWIDGDMIYLDQSHKYQDELFKAIEDKYL